MIEWCRELIESSAVPRSLSSLLPVAGEALSAGDLGAAHRLLLVVLTYDARVWQRIGPRPETFAGPAAAMAVDQGGADRMRRRPPGRTAFSPDC